MKNYVQIGAGVANLDPRTNADGFFNYMQQQPKSEIGKIVLVEPNKINIHKLRMAWADFPMAEIHPKGICPSNYVDRVLTFYYAEEDGPHYQVYSVSKDHVLKHYPNGTIREDLVTCTTINKLIKETIGDNSIEMLALDIEGIDAEILFDIDFDIVKAKKISFEHLHISPEQRQQIDRLLRSKGYKFVGNGLDHLGYDIMYEKEDNSQLAKSTLLDNGDLLLEFPTGFIDKTGWNEGDEISIGLDTENGKIIMRKVTSAE